MRTSQMKLDIWSPYAIIGHLIHGEKTDWLPRVIVILESGPDHPFESFDGDAQFRDSKGKSISSLLDEFAERRSDNLVQLRALNLQPAQLELVGTHPALGRVRCGNSWRHGPRTILRISCRSAGLWRSVIRRK